VARWPIVGALLLAACAPPRAEAVELRARLSGDAVVLQWTESEEAAGYWLELATPGSDFTKLALLWRGETQFVHERVAPDTTFLYRVRPFVGEPSRAVPAEPAPALPEPWSTLEEGPILEARAAPAPGLDVARVATSAAELRWPDRARDEDGYMVEMARQGASAFQLGALLPADSTSFRKLSLPTSRVHFRVRPFTYRAPSQIVSLHTRAGP
jgi:hypothetical protein